jgi:hypothetical protein
MRAPTSVRDDPGSLRIVPAPAGGLWPAVLTAVRDELAHEGTVGVIVPDAWTARAARTLAGASVEHQVLGGDDAAAQKAGELPDEPSDGLPDGLPPRVSVIPATTAKGLEYDHVVVVEPAAIARAEPDERTGLRRLYVVLTRAVSGLAVVHEDQLPAALADTGDGPSS